MPSNAERWAQARFTRSTPINAAAEKIAANRARYEVVSKATGVPWDVIGVIHYRESSNHFAGVLHNGSHVTNTYVTDNIFFNTGAIDFLVKEDDDLYGMPSNTQVGPMFGQPGYGAGGGLVSLGGVGSTKLLGGSSGL
jgi:hypothetical protein